ncbi:MAG TPA: hypothetical protein VGB77_19635 [Abditibacteriaceae bacterium]|jgi:hypothetical protein
MDAEPIRWNDDEPGNEFRIADYSERSARIQRLFLPPNIEFDSEEYWGYMRNLTPVQRFQQSSEMTEFFVNEVHAEILADYPDWDDKSRKIEFVRRMYGPTLAGHLQRWMEKRETNGDSD